MPKTFTLASGQRTLPTPPESYAEGYKIGVSWCKDYTNPGGPHVPAYDINLDAPEYVAYAMAAERSNEAWKAGFAAGLAEPVTTETVYGYVKRKVVSGISKSSRSGVGVHNV